MKKLDDNKLNENFVENRIKKFHQRVELSRSEKIKNEMKKNKEKVDAFERINFKRIIACCVNFV